MVIFKREGGGVSLSIQKNLLQISLSQNTRWRTRRTARRLRTQSVNWCLGRLEQIIKAEKEKLKKKIKTKREIVSKIGK